MPAILVLATFPDIEKARQIGTALVEKQLAACVNLIPNVESIYRWEGKVETASEVQALIKTTSDRYPELEKAICDLHPYEVPEIIAVEIAAGLPAYLRWVESEAPGISDQP
ncbi:MAG: periplasmic divalent cation tolerance protein [Verrucomicrobiales bacterium]|jgi:periplasmic divalent cation tolerance protein